MGILVGQFALWKPHHVEISTFGMVTTTRWMSERDLIKARKRHCQAGKRLTDRKRFENFISILIAEIIHLDF